MSIVCPYVVHTVTHSFMSFAGWHAQRRVIMSSDTIWTVCKQGTLSLVTFLAHRTPLAISQYHEQRQLPHLSWGSAASTLSLTPISMGRAHFKGSTDNKALDKPSHVFDSCSFSGGGSHNLGRKPHSHSHILATPALSSALS